VIALTVQAADISGTEMAVALRLSVRSPTRLDRLFRPRRVPHLR